MMRLLGARHSLCFRGAGNVAITVVNTTHEPQRFKKTTKKHTKKIDYQYFSANRVGSRKSREVNMTLSFFSFWRLLKVAKKNPW